MNQARDGARRRKVALLMAQLARAGHPTTRAESDRQIAELTFYSEAERLTFARSAGCRPPSDETWEMFLRRADARLTSEDERRDPFARVGSA